MLFLFFKEQPESYAECWTDATLCYFFSYFSGSCVSQSITPLENKVRVDALEDETVTLSCKYEGRAYYLYWYRQYSGSRPEFLLRIDPDTNAVAHATPRFPRLDTKLNGRTLILLISSAAISDSALYYSSSLASKYRNVN
uniref:Immunoglobulin V-set domain-containing protein n=1 Tax=Pygocentrus nattereri TaxID=42514 RepID=A0A3B4DX28_PYGNA